MRKAFTLVELLVMLAIIGIVAALVLGLVNGWGHYDTKTQGIYRCVKTYVLNTGVNQSSKRVDLQPQNNGPVQVFRVDNDWKADVSNSATLYAQFEVNKWYSVSSVGHLDESVGLFPLVTSVHEVPDPTKPVQAESE